MSKYYEVALAIDARDVDVIYKDIEKIPQKPKELIETTPDNDYVIYYWDYVQWEGVDELLHKLEHMRHALYTISEDDEIWKDVEVSDRWGTDEIFYEMLDVVSGLRVYGDNCMLKNKQPAKIITDIEWDGPDYLPKTTAVPAYIENEDVAGYLTDKYEYCIKSYCAPFDYGWEEAPDLIGDIISVFEDFLEFKGIDIPNDERDEENAAIIYGSDYDIIRSDLEKVLEIRNIIPER